MQKYKPSRLEKSLHIEFDNNSDDLWLSNGYTLRKLIGILGMALPFTLYLFVLLDTRYVRPLESISHYYYTNAGSVLHIIVGLLAIFLIIYKVNDRTGFYVSSIAGVFAILLLLFPTDNILGSCNCNPDDHIITFVKHSSFRVYFHFISAAIFLLALAYISYFVFTKPNSCGTEVKKRNRVIYRACAVGIVFCIVFIGISSSNIFGDGYNQWYMANQLTFWLETVAIEFFGISWLTKGGVLQKDISCV